MMKAQIARWESWYQTLQARERRMVAIGSVVLAVLVLVGGVLLPVQSATSTALRRVETRREDLEWMQRNAPEIEAAGTLRVSDDHDPPVVIVDRVAHQDGLGEALRGTQPSPNGVRVQLEGAPFDTVVTWISTLDSRYGLALDSITVDRGAKPGLVNANVTFLAPKR
ncbi:MAG TPA: type II secretion system protein GspM [Steroidobacteraceae bacterium]|nr:type II secretion system protein GspM [Steroidobacteraceae bacterium]